MQKLLFSLSTLAIFALFFLAIGPAFAQHQHGAHQHGADPAQTQILVSHGVVEEIDAKNSTIVLTHEAIEALNWEAMVMPFIVEDPSLLEGVKVSDKVRFDLKVTTQGSQMSYQIVDLEVENES
ncbi:MAG: copper-binding protein [Deltaproteobacteria bacterium]|jgi:Cu/Ag efflux protein CusF|nr:copper-binding protein [Deltaproteobacteria bacterium]